MAKTIKQLMSINDQYRHLLDHSPLPVAIHIDGIVKYANKAAIKLIAAKSEKELINKSILSFVHPDFHRVVKKRMLQIISGAAENTEPLHEKLIRRDGKVIDVEIVSVAFFHEGKRAIQLTARDITDQLEAENKLWQSNHALNAIIRSSPLAVYVIDTKGKVILWNKVAEKIFGWTEQEILHKRLPISNKDKTKEFKLLMKELLKGKSFSKDLVRYRKNGSAVDVNISATPLCDEHNKITSIVAITSDISERKKTENERKQYIEQLSLAKQELEIEKKKIALSENRYRTIIEQSPLSTQIFSPTGVTIKVNKAWEQLWGITFEHVRDYNILKDTQLVEKGVMQYIQKGFKGKASTIPAIKYEPDKTIKNISSISHRWVQAFIYPVKDTYGKIREVILVHEDITVRKELERQKDDFIGIASHELKTPVTSIKIYGQVLAKMFNNKGDLQAASLMKKMDTQIDKLSHLIRDLLDVTKNHSGRMQFKFVTYDFNTVVNEIVEEVQRITETHTIIKKLAPSMKIYGDKERTCQVITNFITNAIKYSPYKSRVVITTVNKKDCVQFSVQDFGIGISKEEQKKIFNQFYRINIPKSETFPGLGLGLYISNEIIKRQHGKIWVKSIVGKGSTFYFSLPFSS